MRAASARGAAAALSCLRLRGAAGGGSSIEAAEGAAGACCAAGAAPRPPPPPLAQGALAALRDPRWLAAVHASFGHVPSGGAGAPRCASRRAGGSAATAARPPAAAAAASAAAPRSPHRWRGGRPARDVPLGCVPAAPCAR
jgi:hypothetical protein